MGTTSVCAVGSLMADLFHMVRVFPSVEAESIYSSVLPGAIADDEKRQRLRSLCDLPFGVACMSAMVCKTAIPGYSGCKTRLLDLESPRATPGQGKDGAEDRLHALPPTPNCIAAGKR